MRFKISMCLAGITLLMAFAIAPVQVTSQSSQVMYKIIPLPTLGGVSGAGNGINDRDWITGAADEAGEPVSHAPPSVVSPLTHSRPLSPHPPSPPAASTPNAHHLCIR